MADKKYVEVNNLEVSDYVTVWGCNCSEYGKQTVMAADDLHYLPYADVIEHKYAKWVACKNNSGYKCSNCGARIKNSAFHNGRNWCYNCGFDMRQKEQIKE